MIETWEIRIQDRGKHSLGWNRTAKKADAYHIATRPTGTRRRTP